MSSNETNIRLNHFESRAELIEAAVSDYCKQHELPNLCLKDFAQLGQAARRAVRRMRRRSALVESFWKQAELF